MAGQQVETRSGDIARSADTKQFLTFSLGDEEYGVDILMVQEIKGYVSTTRIPNAPPDVRGVINLRGTVVPIIDLRSKFHLDKIEYDQFNVIIVVVVQGRVMGIVVDSVSEVMNIPVADIQSPTEFNAGMDTTILQGLARVSDQLIILLNVESLLLGNDQRN